MNKFLIIFGIIGIFFLNGCTNIAVDTSKKSELNVYHDKSIKTGMQLIREPELEIISTVEIGENMYQKSYLDIFDTFIATLQIENNQKIFYRVDHSNDNNNSLKSLADSINNIVNSVTPGSYDNKIYVNIDSIGKLLYEWSNSNLKAICSFPNQAYSTYYKECLVDNNNSNLFTHVFLAHDNNLYELNTPIKYKTMQTLPRYSEDSFKYTALYQGKIENKIKISFREFKDNMARPAFTQDIEYELNNDKSTIIGFKGLRVEVIKATNMDITYKIINDYK